MLYIIRRVTSAILSVLWKYEGYLK